MFSRKSLQVASSKQVEPVNPPASQPDFVPLGSQWMPNYLGANSVLQRDVSNMPLAANSAALTAKMVEIKNMRNLVSFNTQDDYTVPLYIMDSSKLSQKSTVRFRHGDGSDKWISQTMRDRLQNNVPIPDDVKIPAGSDKTVEVYDIATNTYLSWWQLRRVSAYNFTAEWGGYINNVYSKTSPHPRYSMQYNEGKVAAASIAGYLGCISRDEIKAGEIRHALAMLTPWAYQDHSWPANGNDGNSTDTNYAMQGQWIRLNPAFDVDAQNYNPILKMVCKALQRYGGTLVDKVGMAYPGIYFQPESNLVEQYKNGTTTNYWTEVINTYAPGFDSGNVLQALPADQLQFAPKDWGKPV